MDLRPKGIGMISVLILMTLMVIPVMTTIPIAIPNPHLPPFLDNLTVTPSEIERGDNVTIGLDVMNPNNRSITYMVTMKIGGWLTSYPYYNVTQIYVELGAYEAKTVSHAITMDRVGNFNVTVDGMTGSFKVKAAPEPDIHIQPRGVPGHDINVLEPEPPFWTSPEFVMAVIVIILCIVAIYVWRRWGFGDLEHIPPFYFS